MNHPNRTKAACLSIFQFIANMGRFPSLWLDLWVTPRPPKNRGREKKWCAALGCVCTPSLTLRPHYARFCVCMCGCQSGSAVQRWRAPQCLFAIDLIKENSPGLRTQRAWGLWHLYEKYSRSADFCHTTPVDKTQLWPTANSERRRRAWKITTHTRRMQPDLLWSRRISILSFLTCRTFAWNYWWKQWLLITARLRGMVSNNARIFSTLHLRHKKWTGRDPN